LVAGIGIDVVEVEDFAYRVRRTPKLLERIFSSKELKLSHSMESLAGRFAAKEAVLKALGKGLKGGIRWRDVEILGGITSPPEVVLKGKAAVYGRGLKFHLSISHSKGVAVAVCVATYSNT